jgi:hypothetical protein
MIFNETGLEHAENAEGMPVIGWQSSVVVGNVAATTEQDDFPASNVASPDTYSKWKGDVNTAGIEYLTVTLAEQVSYLAIARHNFGTQAYSLAVEINTGGSPDWTPIELDLEQAEFTGALLHFDGTDGSTTMTDAMGHSFTAIGNAQIDTAQSVFGGSSLLLDGTGDYVQGDGDDDLALGTGDFTIDFWFRVPSVATGDSQIIYDSRDGISTIVPTIFINDATDQMAYFVDGSTQILGTTVITINAWHHGAITRSGTTTRMFLDGNEQGSFTDTFDYVNPASRPVIGVRGNTISTGFFAGWLDDLRVVKGTAVWTSAFAVPTSAHETTLSAMSVVLDDDDPVIFRFDSQDATGVRLKITTSGESAEPPELAVLYVGELLVMERSLRLNTDHVPMIYGRRTNAVNGMSENGQFLGRIVLSEHRESKAQFQWLTDDFYRDTIDEFLDAAQETPFFFAWSPQEYPEEVSYAWLTNNAEPEVDPTTRRVHLDLEMRGIA